MSSGVIKPLGVFALIKADPALHGCGVGCIARTALFLCLAPPWDVDVEVIRQRAGALLALPPYASKRHAYGQRTKYTRRPFNLRPHSRAHRPPPPPQISQIRAPLSGTGVSRKRRRAWEFRCLTGAGRGPARHAGMAGHCSGTQSSYAGPGLSELGTVFGLHRQSV